VNTETCEVKELLSTRTIKKLVFSQKGRIFVQHEKAIVECSLVLENDKYFLLEKLKGVTVTNGYSRLRLVDFIDDRKTGQYLLLVSDRLVSHQNDRVIYTVNVNGKLSFSADDLKPTFILSTEQGSLKDIFAEHSTQRVIACWDNKLQTIFAVLATQEFALLFMMKMNEDQEVQPSHPVTICNAENIAVVNEQ
jgi:hypothetical protein